MDSLVQRSIFSILLSSPGNTYCADCDNCNPRWASVCFGVLICIRCSGFHRKFGSHITKVKSVDLDCWSIELLNLYKNMSNF